MAKKKKKNTPEPKTYKGYHEGQEVYCVCISDGKLGFGRIHDFHPNCKDPKTGELVDAFTLVCYMRGSYQTSYMSDIIVDPTPQQKQKQKLSMASLYGTKRSKR